MKSKFIITLSFLLLSSFVFSQFHQANKKKKNMVSSENYIESINELIKSKFEELDIEPYTYEPKGDAYELFKQTGHKTREDWLAIMAAKWGPGYPTYIKLYLFDLVWDIIDQYYACFHHIEVDWDAG